jgi:hypothetical protein
MCFNLQHEFFFGVAKMGFIRAETYVYSPLKFSIAEDLSKDYA